MRRFLILTLLATPASAQNLVLSPPVVSTAIAPPGAVDGLSRDARDLTSNIGLGGSLLDASAAQYAALADATHVAFFRGNYVSTIGGAISSRLSTMRAIRAAQMSARKVVFGALVMAYRNDPAPWTAQAPLFQAMLGAGLLKWIEGPNEINNSGTGGGSRGPNDTTDKTSASLFPPNIQDWMAKLVAFKAANAAAFTKFSTFLVGPSVAPIIGGQADYPGNGRVALPGATDFWNAHFYAGSGYQPGLPFGVNSSIGYFANVWRWAGSAYGLGTQGVLSESGASTVASFYAPDGLSQAKYIANQYMDAFKLGVKAVVTYQAFDGDTTPSNKNPEAHFGVYQSDHTTPKPAGRMIPRIIDILSLNNSATDPANAKDHAPFRCGLNSHQIALVGLTSIPTSEFKAVFPGELTICKSDGSAVLAIWNEPAIDSGGTDVIPTVDPVTLYLPRARSWRTHDPMASDSLTGGSWTTSDTVPLNITGYPQFVEIAAPAGYTQLAGDPADMPLSGSTTFALGNSNLSYAANYRGLQPDAMSIPFAPPAGHLWTPGNVAIIFVTYGTGATSPASSAPTVTGSTATYGPYTYSGLAESVIGFSVPITNAHQQIIVSNTGSFAQGAIYEVPPFSAAAVSVSPGSINGSHLITGALAAVSNGAIGLFYVGMGTTYSLSNVSQSSDSGLVILQQRQTSDGANTYNTGFSGTVSAGRDAGTATWQTPDYSPNSNGTQPIVVTWSATR